MDTTQTEEKTGFEAMRDKVWAIAQESCEMAEKTDFQIIEALAFRFTVRYALKAEALADTLEGEAEVKLLRRTARDLSMMQRVHLQTRRMEMAERAEEARLNEKKVQEIEEEKAKMDYQAHMLDAKLKIGAERNAKAQNISVEKARAALESDPTVAGLLKQIAEAQKAFADGIQYYKWGTGSRDRGDDEE